MKKTVLAMIIFVLCKAACFAGGDMVAVKGVPGFGPDRCKKILVLPYILTGVSGEPDENAAALFGEKLAEMGFEVVGQEEAMEFMAEKSITVTNAFTKANLALLQAKFRFCAVVKGNIYYAYKPNVTNPGAVNIGGVISIGGQAGGGGTKIDRMTVRFINGQGKVLFAMTCPEIYLAGVETMTGEMADALYGAISDTPPALPPVK